MERVDIAIIGGGILGCATAYFLARQGAGKVALFERHTLGAAATSRAAAMFNRSRPVSQERQMVRDTYALIPELEAEIDDTLGYRQVGSMTLARNGETKKSVTALIEACIDQGDDFRWITPIEARVKTPWLAPDGDELIAWCPDDGYIDPYRLATGYGRAAKLRGVALHQNVEVTAVVVEGGRAVGLETTEGPVAADLVIDAAGPWSAVLAQRAGVSLPLAPVRSHYWITESKTPFDSAHPVMVMPDAKAYARPEVGAMLFGIRDKVSPFVTPDNLPADISGFSFDTDYEGWDALADGIAPLLAYCPELESAKIEHYISGPSAYTPDGRFVIGPVPTLDGFLAVTGCCGAGIAHSSGFGKIAAALALGQDVPFDVSPYDPGRFGAFDPLSEEFCARCAASRAVKNAA